MSRYTDKSHNVSVLLYHLVFPAKYRRAVFNAAVDQALREVCLEIGTDKDHVHFLVQSVPEPKLTGSVRHDWATASAAAGGIFGRSLCALRWS